MDFSNCSHDVLNIVKAEGSTGNIDRIFVLVALPGLLHMPGSFWETSQRLLFGHVTSKDCAGQASDSSFPTVVHDRVRAIPAAGGSVRAASDLA